MVTTAHVRHSPRMAGNVVRYHAWPTLRQQSNAHHTWNVMRIYRELWGRLSPALTDLALYHDAGELNGADAPHDVKVAIPELKAACDLAEARGLELIGAPDSSDATDQERLRFKVCDLLEMAEFAAEEIEMGNKLMFPVLYNIENALYHHLQWMEEGDRVAVGFWVTAFNMRIESAHGRSFQLLLSGKDRR